MPLSVEMRQAMIDWVCGGSAPARPSNRWIAFATATPTTQSAFDAAMSPRRTCTFAAANSPQGSATNLNAMTQSATAICTPVAWNLWNASVGGTRLLWGTLSAALGCASSADSAAFAAGNLKVTLT